MERVTSNLPCTPEAPHLEILGNIYLPSLTSQIRHIRETQQRWGVGGGVKGQMEDFRSTSE